MTEQEASKWCYSWNDENFYGKYDTMEEALIDAKKDNPDAEFVIVGTRTDVELSWSGFDAEDVINAIEEDLYEEVGDAVESFEVSADDEVKLGEILDEAIKKWIEQCNIKANCYKVLDSEEVELNLNLGGK